MRKIIQLMGTGGALLTRSKRFATTARCGR